MIRCKTVRPLIVQKTRFDRVLELVAIVLILLAWFAASCLYVLDNQYFLYFLFSALSTMLAGIMFLTVRIPDKFRIKMHVDLGGDAIVLQSRLVLRCIRWIGVTFALQGHFFIWGFKCLRSEGLHSCGIFLFVIAAAGTLSFVISILVYYTMRINKLNKKSDNI